MCVDLPNTGAFSVVAEKQRHQIKFASCWLLCNCAYQDIAAARSNRLNHQALHGRWGGAPFHGRDLLGHAVRGGASGLGRILHTMNRCVYHCYGH